MCCDYLYRSADARIYMLELVWRRLARRPMQSSSMLEDFFCCIDACVSLYHTRNASCDMFKLAGVCLHRTKNATIDILKKQGLGGVRETGELEGGIGDPGIGVSAQAQKVRCMCTL